MRGKKIRMFSFILALVTVLAFGGTLIALSPSQSVEGGNVVASGTYEINRLNLHLPEGVEVKEAER